MKSQTIFFIMTHYDRSDNNTVCLCSWIRHPINLLEATSVVLELQAAVFFQLDYFWEEQFLQSSTFHNLCVDMYFVVVVFETANRQFSYHCSHCSKGRPRRFTVTSTKQLRWPESFNYRPIWIDISSLISTRSTSFFDIFHRLCVLIREGQRHPREGLRQP